MNTPTPGCSSSASTSPQGLVGVDTLRATSQEQMVGMFLGRAARHLGIDPRRPYITNFEVALPGKPSIRGQIGLSGMGVSLVTGDDQARTTLSLINKALELPSNNGCLTLLNIRNRLAMHKKREDEVKRQQGEIAKLKADLAREKKQRQDEKARLNLREERISAREKIVERKQKNIHEHEASLLQKEQQIKNREVLAVKAVSQPTGTSSATATATATATSAAKPRSSETTIVRQVRQHQRGLREQKLNKEIEELKKKLITTNKALEESEIQSQIRQTRLDYKDKEVQSLKAQLQVEALYKEKDIRVQTLERDNLLLRSKISQMAASPFSASSTEGRGVIVRKIPEEQHIHALEGELSALRHQYNRLVKKVSQQHGGVTLEEKVATEAIEPDIVQPEQQKKTVKSRKRPRIHDAENEILMTKLKWLSYQLAEMERCLAHQEAEVDPMKSLLQDACDYFRQHGSKGIPAVYRQTVANPDQSDPDFKHLRVAVTAVKAKKQKRLELDLQEHLQCSPRISDVVRPVTCYLSGNNWQKDVPVKERARLDAAEYTYFDGLLPQKPFHQKKPSTNVGILPTIDSRTMLHRPENNKGCSGAAILMSEPSPQHCPLRPGTGKFRAARIDTIEVDGSQSAD